MDVAKFSACFCHQSITIQCVSCQLAPVMEGSSVQKTTVFAYDRVASQCCKSVNFGAALCESDAYPQQFRTEKSKFITLVGFTVVCSCRISLGNAKDEGLKQLWRDLSSKKANFLNQCNKNSCIFCTGRNFWTHHEIWLLLLLLLAVAKVEAPALTGTAPGFAIFPTTFFLFT